VESEIDEMFTQKSGSNPMCWSAPEFVLKSGIFWHTYSGCHCAPFPTLSSPNKPFLPSQS